MSKKRLTRWSQFAKPKRPKLNTPAQKWCHRFEVTLTILDDGKYWQLRWGKRKKRFLEWWPETGAVKLDGEPGGTSIGWPKLQERLERIMVSDLVNYR